jgi:cysteine-rich repeat protein
VDVPIVVMPDGAPTVDSPVAVTDVPVPPIDSPPSFDAPPPVDAPPPPIDAPPPIDSPPGDPCGNGIVDQGETCDIGITAGNPGACPTDCNDSDACTDDALTGTRCTQRCTHTPRTPNPVADSCCPIGANGTTDPDCAVCGNGILELGEVCDDHNTLSGDGCAGDCMSREIVGYRLDTLKLQFPHTYLSLGCNDVTSIVQGGIDDQLSMDADHNGFLDLSPMVVFKPYDRDDATTPADIVFAQCSANAQASPRCSGVGLTDPNRIAGTATNTLTGVTACLTNYDLPPTGVTPRGYTPTINSVAPPPCFSTNALSKVTLNVSVAGTIVAIPLEDVKLAAVYNANPATSLTTGLFRGFLTETDANSIMVLGTPLSGYLAGGSGACPAWNDSEMGPIGAQTPVKGWYFYLNFTAVRETYIDQ